MPTGWTKSDTIKRRRQIALRSHRGDLLATARSMQSIANLNRDKETQLKASADALFFYKLYRRRKALIKNKKK